MAVRILLVDDHQVLREGLGSLLEQQSDMEVVGEAGNGNEAIEQYEALRPDVIVMDISMPEMDGFQTCIRIKDDDKTSDIPIIYLSALFPLICSLSFFIFFNSFKKNIIIFF